MPLLLSKIPRHQHLTGQGLGTWHTGRSPAGPTPTLAIIKVTSVLNWDGPSPPLQSLSPLGISYGILAPCL